MREPGLSLRSRAFLHPLSLGIAPPDTGIVTRECARKHTIHDGPWAINPLAATGTSGIRHSLRQISIAIILQAAGWGACVGKGSGLRVRACRASTPRPTTNQLDTCPHHHQIDPPPKRRKKKNYSPIPFRYSSIPLRNVLGLALKSSRPPQPVPSDRVRRPRCSQSSAPRQLSQCRPSLRYPEPTYGLPPRGACR